MSRMEHCRFAVFLYQFLLLFFLKMNFKQMAKIALANTVRECHYSASTNITNMAFAESVKRPWFQNQLLDCLECKKY